MNDDRNPFDDATAVADQAELLELQKPKRNFANVVKRGQPSQSTVVRTPQPSPQSASPQSVSPQPVSQPHLIRRDAAGLPEDSSEVLLTPANITVPLGKAGGASAYQEHNGNEEFTVEEGRPQPPAALVDIAEQANLAVAPPDDPDRGFLVITGGNDKGRKVGLPEGRTTIGRGIDCDIVLTDIAVSRRHMYVERRDNVYFLCDLSSGNGTFVNNKDRRGEVVVVNGDTFKIGSTLFSFEGPEAQDSAAATTNWQPEAVASGKAVGRYDSQALAEEEESTVAGKGLANVREEHDPPSELPTNIVASVEVAPQLQARPPRPATKPPPLPQDLRDAEHAALAAVSSIIQTPPPEEISVIPLQTGDLPELSIPPTPSPAIPYPIPGQQSAPAPAPPHSSLPQPRGNAPSAAVPAMQGHMGMAPPIQQGPSSMHMQPSYPVPGSMPQGSNPMMGRPMMAGARPDFHNPYQPANRAAPPARGRLLIGIISVALVLVVVGIVAAVVGQGEDKVATTPAAIGADGGTGEAAGALATDSATTAGSDAAAGEAEAVAENTEPENTEPIAEGTASESEPILVASLIAGTTQLPASTWGNSELFTKEVEPETAPVPEPIVEPVPEPIVEPVVEPKPDPKPVAETPKPLVRKPKPVVVRKPRVEPKPRQDPDESSGNQVNTSAAKSSARALYKRREYAAAASTLEKAASRIEDDDDAMKLNDIADAYKKVGSSMEKAERIQNSSPIEALELYKKSLSRDKKYAGGALAKLIRLRIGQVAPKAAKTLMAQGKLSKAKKAADTAKRYDEGQAVESVYKSLERKANSLIKKALKAKKNGDDDEAKDLLREATSIAPKDTPAYDKCRAELRKL